MTYPLAPKQLEFVLNSTAKWNLAHGSVRSGKTVCTLFRFLHAINACPDSQIWMIGHSSTTIYDNAIRLILESPQFEIFRPFCTWFPGAKKLKFKNKTISTLGAKDEGALAPIQGKTISRLYCDEMTLYPESIIEMLDTRLSNPHSMGFASMNPSYPTHTLKKWIDKGNAGDKNYYSLHFNVEDNPFLDKSYIERIKHSLTGVFYKRNYLGLWCLADGAIFDFFDRAIHTREKPPCAAEYWIAGIDVGTRNAFACVLIGVSTGKYTQTGKRLWVEREYFWDSATKGRQKTNSEYARDVQLFLEDYGVRDVYVDPSAAAFKEDLRRVGFHPIDANNEVLDGIQMLSNEINCGNLVILEQCENLIREIESYVWDSKKAIKGYDEPIKQDDHAIDALRYAIATHKVPKYYGNEDENFGRTLGGRR